MINLEMEVVDNIFSKTFAYLINIRIDIILRIMIAIGHIKACNLILIL